MWDGVIDLDAQKQELEFDIPFVSQGWGHRFGCTKAIADFDNESVKQGNFIAEYGQNTYVSMVFIFEIYIYVGLKLCNVY